MALPSVSFGQVNLVSDEAECPSRSSISCSQNCPVNSLPPEVLIRIFQLHVLYHQNRYTQHPFYKPYIWLSIFHVCRKWREIGLNETQFWTWLVPTRYPECAEYFISHAGTRPLSIEIHSYRTLLHKLTVLRLLEELPRIRALILSGAKSWEHISDARCASLNAPILENLSISMSRKISNIPKLSSSPLPKLKILSAEHSSYALLRTLVRPTLTVLVLRNCSLQGGSFLDLLHMVPSLQSLCLESEAALELAPRRANPISLPALRRLQIVDHWLVHFCENVQCSWDRVKVDISRGPFITTTRRPHPSNNASIFDCIASYLSTSYGDPETRFFLNVHVTQRYNGRAEVSMTRGRHYNGTITEHGGFTLSIYCRSSPASTIAKHVEFFLKEVPLPNTSMLDIDAALPPSLWQQLSCTHIDQLESLILSKHAVRSFILACNNYTAAGLFLELTELQLRTGEFAIDTRKDSKPYHVLRNLQAALSARKRKGLTLQSLKIVYEGELTDDELASLRAARLAERLHITELGYVNNAQSASAGDISDT